MRLALGSKLGIGGVVLAAVCLAILILALVRSGDSPGAPVQDPGSPLAVTNLPGSGWASSETELVSLFDSPNPVFAVTPDLPECSPLQDLESVLYANEAAFAKGQSRTFERSTSGGGTTRVTQLRVTFSDANVTQDILEAARTTIAGPALAPCLVATAAREGVAAIPAEGPALPTPTGGVSRVLRLTGDGPSGGGTVTEAVGWWSEGQELVVLSISAAGDGPDDATLSAIALAAGAGR